MMYAMASREKILKWGKVDLHFIGGMSYQNDVSVYNYLRNVYIGAKKYLKKDVKEALLYWTRFTGIMQDAELEGYLVMFDKEFDRYIPPIRDLLDEGRLPEVPVNIRYNDYYRMDILEEKLKEVLFNG